MPAELFAPGRSATWALCFLFPFDGLLSFAAQRSCALVHLVSRLLELADTLFQALHFLVELTRQCRLGRCCSAFFLPLADCHLPSYYTQASSAMREECAESHQKIGTARISGGKRAWEILLPGKSRLETATRRRFRENAAANNTA
jgi:hypothetical protein